MSLFSRIITSPFEVVKEIVLNYGIRTVFERLPIISNALSYLNGHKETVGKLVTFGGAILILAEKAFPGTISVGLDEAQIAFFAGVIIDLIGKAHAYDKERRGIERSERIAFGYVAPVKVGGNQLKR
jgi:hypothetical protein